MWRKRLNCIIIVIEQVFGNKPCDGFLKLITEEFAGMFLSTIKNTDRKLALLVSIIPVVYSSFIKCL